MRIAIIGAGKLGIALGRRLAAGQHEVLLSFTRSAATLEAAVASVGGGARAALPEDAVTSADVVVLATPWAVTLATVARLADGLAGKVLWDTTNPLKADLSGLEIGTTTSGGEEVARAAPGARVVKAVPPFAEALAGGSLEIDGRRPGVFACSDDAAAKGTVLALLADIGADGVDAGALSDARSTEPLGLLLVRLAYVQGLGPRIGSALLR